MRRLVYCVAIVFVVFSSQVFSASGLPDFTELVEKNSAAVVKINVSAKPKSMVPGLPQNQQIPEMFRHFFEPRQQRPMQSMGSGFIVSDDGYVMTNHHVIDGADDIVVRMTDRSEYTATLVGTDPRSDLALLKIDAKDLPHIQFADSERLKVGEWVLAIGSPFGLDFSASVGIVSAMGRSIPSESGGSYVPFIQSDVAINPGNSGGPLFDLDGEVVGVNSQIYTRSGGSIGLSFAIPSNVAKNVYKQLKEYGSVARGWLGVVIQDVDKNLADSFGLDKPKGALVVQVVSGGPADEAGLRVGDIVLAFNRQTVRVSGDLPHAVGQTQPGDKVRLSILRSGKQKILNMEVGALDKTMPERKVSQDKGQKGDRLGLDVAKLTDAQKAKLGIDRGVVVLSVKKGSAAANSGIRAGDVITQVGFDEVATPEVFNKIVSGLPQDKLLPIRFFRDGQPVFRTIMIEKS